MITQEIIIFARITMSIIMLIFGFEFRKVYSLISGYGPPVRAIQSNC